ncbi:hypothetical protein BP6252_11051 [Coleophoma cylindrospora]|uniref:Uncharacterized protein n=1 Tax=Coleophoma cylindrospora TaxID=1849047 RepID=A0A3D8QNU7_9HELO|nr:hypothetical protein BP6252_11051 [Coleophoma cylindrospora]
MRLLELKPDGGLSLTHDLVTDIPAYAILSHTWGDDNQEVTFKDLTEGSGESKAGYQKIRFCGEQAARDGLRYFWVDTCCIDKSDAVELQRAINSMFRWYQDAAKCYVYLSDVWMPSHDQVESDSNLGFEATFRTSRWFRRGWTLQELLAPRSVQFFSADHKRLGDKTSLGRLICEVTRIPVQALQRYDPKEFSIDERVSWVERRETKHEEDLAYGLLGIFGVFLPLIYGEGRENALKRLRKEVDESNEIREFEKLSKTKVEPQFRVPFVRDPKFVGRAEITQQITSRLDQQRRVALCGIGGIGKSQIAIEYCYIWRDRYPYCHVFWIHASSLDSFEQAYREIAKSMSIPGSEDPQDDTLATVRDWLSRSENGPWLLILDNADGLELFFESNSSAREEKGPYISSFLPRGSQGSIIITTRDSRIGHRLTDLEEPIMVPPLNPPEAEQLLRCKIPSGDRLVTQEMQSLLEILGFIPLAITQAAAFIQENGIAVRQYINELQQSDSDLQDYLEEHIPDPRRYPESENSVIRTWKLSFDQIARQNTRAANLLSLMVQLDRQAIPKALLKNENERSIEFTKAVGTLQAYSLIKTERDGSTFEVHRLVQLSTQRWLRIQKREAEWQEKALALVENKFLDGYYGTWQECEALLLHAKSVMRYTYVPLEVLLRQANLGERVSRYERSQGRFEAAYLQGKSVVQIRKSNLGEKHPSTLTSMSNLALVLDSQGKYTEAETMNSQTLELSEEVLGKKHPETLTTMSNLALVLNKQGKYTEAETMNRQTLELKEEVLALESQGKYTQAETMHRQTLELSQEVLGKMHPDTLTSIYCLAYTLQGKKEYREASILYDRACNGYKSILGATHPTTVTCIKHYQAMLDQTREENLD